ncbi:MAG: 2OG-Fe(II) oxygenase, partial [Actinobacteria bacterium]|nr:2OG-Fe(II) oxygenase [Actinomycetota bacterium]
AGRDHRVLASGTVDQADRLVRVLTTRDGSDASPSMVPLLGVDDVFAPNLCTRLIAHLDAVVLVDSPSFVPDGEGGTALATDHRLKSRLDHVIVDDDVLAVVAARLRDRLLPEVVRSFAHRPASFEVPKIVRYPAGGGVFRPHRDNVTADTAHRRLAVTINLDRGYVGGRLRFPEVSDDSYQPNPGSAIVFSCGLLHEVTEVERSPRHALITFLW